MLLYDLIHDEPEPAPEPATEEQYAAEGNWRSRTSWTLEGKSVARIDLYNDIAIVHPKSKKLPPLLCHTDVLQDCHEFFEGDLCYEADDWIELQTILAEEEANPARCQHGDEIYSDMPW